MQNVTDNRPAWLMVIGGILKKESPLIPVHIYRHASGQIINFCRRLVLTCSLNIESQDGV